MALLAGAPAHPLRTSDMELTQVPCLVIDYGCWHVDIQHKQIHRPGVDGGQSRTLLMYLAEGGLATSSHSASSSQHVASRHSSHFASSSQHVASRHSSHSASSSQHVASRHSSHSASSSQHVASRHSSHSVSSSQHVASRHSSPSASSSQHVASRHYCRVRR